MIRSFVAAVRKNKELAYCSLDSLLDGVATAAQLGLLLTPSFGHAALVPYAGKCEFQPMYKGLMHLAHQTGRVGKIVGRAVYEDDDFDYLQGTTEYIKHKPKRDGKADPAKLTHAYAIAWIIGADDPTFVVLNRAQVKRAEAMSKATYKGRPWEKHTEAMWIKTAVKVLAKFIPIGPDDKASVMFANAVQYDDTGTMDRTPKKIDVEQLEDIVPTPDDEEVDGELVDSGLEQLSNRMEGQTKSPAHDPETGETEPTREELKKEAMDMGLVDDSCRYGAERLRAMIDEANAEMDEARQAAGDSGEQPQAEIDLDE
jgi:recombination protein RecT